MGNTRGKELDVAVGSEWKLDDVANPIEDLSLVRKNLG